MWGESAVMYRSTVLQLALLALALLTDAQTYDLDGSATVTQVEVVHGGAISFSIPNAAPLNGPLHDDTKGCIHPSPDYGALDLRNVQVAHDSSVLVCLARCGSGCS